MKHKFILLFLAVFPGSLHTMLLEQFCSLPLKSSFQYIDPAIGAAYWESGIIKRWFSFLPYKNPPKGSWLGDGEGPTRLLHALFNSVLNHDDIDISDNPSYVAKHLQPSTIGIIIAAIETSRAKNLLLTTEHLENLIVKERGFSSSIEEIAREKKRLTGSISATSLNRYDTSRLFRDLEHREKITAFEKELQGLTALKGFARKKADKQIENLKKLITQAKDATPTRDCNRVREFVDALFESDKPTPTTPCWATRAILFAFLYRKIKSKQDIDNYVTGAASLIGEVIIDNNAPKPNHIEQIKNQLLRWQSTGNDAHELFLHLYKPTIYAQILTRYFQGAFPKKAEYTSLYYGRYNFSDCVETVIRNICNRILYQKENGVFDIAKGISLITDQATINFYQKPLNKLASNVEAQSSSEDWLKVVENRPWIAYRRILRINKDQSCITVNAPVDTVGYIKGIPASLQAITEQEGARIKLGNHWYILVDDPGCELYEMEPSLHNLIIMLDQLLNLNLFNQSLEREFVRPDFVAHYLPLIGKRIPFLSTSSLTQSFLASLDATEYTDKIRELYFDGFSLYFARDDADIEINRPSTTLVDLAPPLFKLLDAIHPHDEHFDKIINLLAIFPFLPTALSFELFSQLIFWLDLDNQEVILSLFQHHFRKQKLLTLPDDHFQFIISIIANIIKKLPRRFDWRYHTKIMAIMDPWLMTQPPIREVFDELALFAHLRKEGAEAEKEELINFFEALLHFPEYRTVVSQEVSWFMQYGSERDKKIIQEMTQSSIV